MEALNQELYNAINLLCIAWGEPPRPEAGLAKTMDYLLRNPTKRTTNWSVIRFNRIVSADYQGRNLGEMLLELKAQNPALAEYSFHQLQSIIRDNGDERWI